MPPDEFKLAIGRLTQSSKVAKKKNGLNLAKTSDCSAGVLACECRHRLGARHDGGFVRPMMVCQRDAADTKNRGGYATLKWMSPRLCPLRLRVE